MCFQSDFIVILIECFNVFYPFPQGKPLPPGLKQRKDGWAGPSPFGMFFKFGEVLGRISPPPKSYLACYIHEKCIPATIGSADEQPDADQFIDWLKQAELPEPGDSEVELKRKRDRHLR